MVTTHASYPYQPWIVESGLHTLRVSIDGAFPQNYQKYRVGGRLATALGFLESLRDHRLRAQSPLLVCWKYILFEWNDSDEEIREAARLAAQLDVELSFILTHSPGRSRRFSNSVELRKLIQVLAPTARSETTFQLEDPGAQSMDASSGTRITSLLKAAKKLIDDGDERNALGLIYQALDQDCGVRPREYLSGRDLVRAYVPLLLESGRHPWTLVQVSEILQGWGDYQLVIPLLKKYVKTQTSMSHPQRLWLALRLLLQLRTRCRAVARRLWERSA